MLSKNLFSLAPCTPCLRGEFLLPKRFGAVPYLPVSPTPYPQVQTAGDKQAEADDGVHVEKGGVYAGKVVGADECVFVNEEDGDRGDGEPVERTELRIDEREARECDDREEVAEGGEAE